MQDFLRTSIAAAVFVMGPSLHGHGFLQSLNPSPNGSVILEVTATHRSWGEETYSYVYIRLLSDQTVEWQSPINRENKPFGTFRKMLTKNEFDKIKSVLDDDKLRKLRPRYELWFTIVDSSEEWKINLPHPEKPQVVEILQSSHFSPALAKESKHPLPGGLVKLGCTIQKLRGDVLGEGDVDLDGECKRVLKISAKKPSH
jgi:hypothetical protein